MSSKAASPTARLLRSSRLFSLPQPLARPAEEAGNRLAKLSDSATLPHPVQQAIVTPPSSLARGDWGLKRPLPLRSTTKSSTPIFRINAVDTLEHITDFDSAADLSLNLQKFQELNLPITTNAARTTKSAASEARSVFERDLDNTDPLARGLRTTRWKYKGPWVAGMSQGDFNNYVDKEIAKRKPEFMALLRERFQEMQRAKERTDARDAGREFVDAAEEFSETKFEAWLKSIRGNFSLSSELNALIVNFLDLPSSATSAERANPTSSSNLFSRYTDGEQPPPKTHPSAGLSYLRTKAYLDNHPLFGPQEQHAPVEARLLAGAGRQFDRAAAPAKLGVAGFVGRDIPGGHSQRIRSVPVPDSEDDPAAQLDRSGNTMGVFTDGGNRVWVDPERASIDARGRVQILVRDATGANVGVHTGQVNGPAPPRQSSSASPGQLRMRSIMDEVTARGSRQRTNSTMDVAALLNSLGGGNPTTKH